MILDRFLWGNSVVVFSLILIESGRKSASICSMEQVLVLIKSPESKNQTNEKFSVDERFGEIEICEAHRAIALNWLWAEPSGFK